MLQYVGDVPGGPVKLQLGLPLVAVAIGLMTKGKTRKAAFTVAAGSLLLSALL